MKLTAAEVQHLLKIAERLDPGIKEPHELESLSRDERRFLAQLIYALVNESFTPPKHRAAKNAERDLWATLDNIVSADKHIIVATRWGLNDKQLSVIAWRCRKRCKPILAQFPDRNLLLKIIAMHRPPVSELGDF